MERTSVLLGGVEIGSSVMNASGARSAERGEIYELCAVHRGPVVFKSCSVKPLAMPENLKNGGIAHFVPIAQELSARSRTIIGSVVGQTQEEFVEVARALDRAGAKIIELNLADDYVLNSLAPFASAERLKSLIGRVRAETGAVLAVKVPLPPKSGSLGTSAIAELLRTAGVKIAVCANDLRKDLQIELATGNVAGKPRSLSQAHAFFNEARGQIDVVAVGGVASGREAYVAHLTGATAVQVGSALMKEGPGALGRIDRELDAMLAEHAIANVSQIIGKVRFG